VNFILVNDRFYLVDLPGYGYAKVSAAMRKRWRMLIYDFIEKRRSLGGVIQLVDARHPEMRDDLGMLQHLIDSGRPFLVVLTKADKIGRSKRAHVLRAFRSHFDGIDVGPYDPEAAGGAEVPFVFFSARTGEGRDVIWSWIKSII
jgi:GTP-binding protein